MFKKCFLVTMLVIVMLFSACSKANDYNITFTADGKDTIYNLGFDEFRQVYALGGIVMIEVEGEQMLLEQAIQDGRISIDEILNSVIEDAEDEDIEFTEYPDGCVEYCYEGFKLVDVNRNGEFFVYFIPDTMDYRNIP